MRPLTWVGRGEDAAAAKVAVEVMAAGGLVVGVHGIRGVGQERVGVEARAAVLYGPAIRPAAAARVVDVALQLR